MRKREKVAAAKGISGPRIIIDYVDPRFKRSYHSASW